MATVLLLQSSFAEDKQYQLTKDFSHKVGALVYNIQNLQNGLIEKDVINLSGPAGAALDYKVAAEIAEVFQTGIDFLKVIAEDKTLTKEQKRPLINDLGSALGTVFLIVLRHHGDDAIDIKRSSSSQDKVLNLAITSAKEVAGIIPNLFKFPKTANGNRISLIKERMIRDLLGQKTIIMFQYAVKQMGEINDERADDVIRRMLAVPQKEIDASTDINEYGVDKEGTDRIGVARRGLIIRENRKKAHYVAYASLAGLAAIWGVTPVDFVGWGIGYDGVTPILSDTIAASVLASLYTTKAITSAFGTIDSLKKLVSIVENPEQSAEFSKIKLPLIARLLKVEQKFEQARGAVNPKYCINYYRK